MFVYTHVPVHVVGVVMVVEMVVGAPVVGELGTRPARPSGFAVECALLAVS